MSEPKHTPGPWEAIIEQMQRQFDAMKSLKDEWEEMYEKAQEEVRRLARAIIQAESKLHGLGLFGEPENRVAEAKQILDAALRPPADVTKKGLYKGVSDAT
jgi:hypothetical protein